MVKKLQLNPRNELEQLLQDNYGLIVAQAVRFKPKNIHILEEFIQVGVTAFIKSAGNFDPNKGKFSTYISHCIHHAIFDFAKKNNRGIFIEFSDNIPMPETCESIEDLLPNSLTEQEHTIIQLKLQNYSKKEIADMLSITSAELNKSFNTIKQKIKKANED